MARIKTVADARHTINAAEGWLLLGDWGSAEAELESLPAELQRDASVLTLRASILMAGKQWQRLVETCGELVRERPEESFGWIHRSFALHELKRTSEAWELLLPAVKHFPKEWLIRYNLACYAAQLGRLDEAVSLLEESMKLGNAREIAKMAKEDPDLEPILPLLG